MTSEEAAGEPAAGDQVQAADPPRPLRRDAERNRQRILEAAAEVFNERGLEVSLDDVARHAGVTPFPVPALLPEEMETTLRQRTTAPLMSARHGMRGCVT